MLLRRRGPIPWAPASLKIERYILTSSKNFMMSFRSAPFSFGALLSSKAMVLLFLGDSSGSFEPLEAETESSTRGVSSAAGDSACDFCASASFWLRLRVLRRDEVELLFAIKE